MNIFIGKFCFILVLMFFNIKREVLIILKKIIIIALSTLVKDPSNRCIYILSILSISIWATSKHRPFLISNLNYLEYLSNSCALVINLTSSFYLEKNNILCKLLVCCEMGKFYHENFNSKISGHLYKILSKHIFFITCCISSQNEEILQKRQKMFWLLHCFSKYPKEKEESQTTIFKWKI